MKMRLAYGLAVVLVCACASLQAQRRFDERELKATYLFQFAHFVEWPATSAGEPRASFVICILGVDPFGRLMDELVAGEAVNDRPLKVVRVRRLDEVTRCDILFVSKSETSSVPQIMAALRGRPILTVGDTEGFARSGGMIRFITERNMIRLRINLDESRAVGIAISSRLLRAADIVTTDEGR